MSEALLPDVLALATLLPDADALPAGDWAVLCAAAFATAILSAIVGLAGGMTLLAVMLLFLDPITAIPLHGVIQLASNGSRTAIQRRHVRWPLVARYALLLAPTGLLGLMVLRSLPADVMRAAIGAFVLLATWAPGALLLGAHPEAAPRNRRFFVLGGVSGFLNVTVGATGPLVAPFFLKLGLTRQAVIGTQAACQATGHLTKIVLFGLGGFVFGPHLPGLAAAMLCVVAGTWVGSRLLDRVSEPVFGMLYRLVLTAVAVRLVADLLPGSS